jgi:AcrR family transcriptional regulator
LATSGYLPPAIACRFTTAELAVLTVLAKEHFEHGGCERSIGEIAARAGVSESTVRNTWRNSKALGLITVEQRRVSYDRNLPNLVAIVSREWLGWLNTRPSQVRGVGANLYRPRVPVNINRQAGSYFKGEEARRNGASCSFSGSRAR